jgi:hypothetical protein
MMPDFSLKGFQRPTAVPQLLYPETTSLKWHFPQENATLHDASKGT